jgi:hypothetical protein
MERFYLISDSGIAFDTPATIPQLSRVSQGVIVSGQRLEISEPAVISPQHHLDTITVSETLAFTEHEIEAAYVLTDTQVSSSSFDTAAPVSVATAFISQDIAVTGQEISYSDAVPAEAFSDTVTFSDAVPAEAFSDTFTFSDAIQTRRLFSLGDGIGCTACGYWGQAISVPGGISCNIRLSGLLQCNAYVPGTLITVINESTYPDDSEVKYQLVDPEGNITLLSTLTFALTQCGVYTVIQEITHADKTVLCKAQVRAADSCAELQVTPLPPCADCSQDIAKRHLIVGQDNCFSVQWHSSLAGSGFVREITWKICDDKGREVVKGSSAVSSRVCFKPETPGCYKIEIKGKDICGRESTYIDTLCTEPESGLIQVGCNQYKLYRCRMCRFTYEYALVPYPFKTASLTWIQADQDTVITLPQSGIYKIITR